MAKLTRQQGILIFIMAIAIFYGIYNFASSARAKVKEVAKQSEELDTFVNNITEGIIRDLPTATDNYLIHQAETEWKNDPCCERKAYREFLMSGEQAKTSGSVEAKISFYYSGYMEIGSRKIAIVNDMEYEAGDPLDIEGYVLESVQPTKIVIENKSEGTKFEVLLLEIEE